MKRYMNFWNILEGKQSLTNLCTLSSQSIFVRRRAKCLIASPPTFGESCITTLSNTLPTSWSFLTWESMEAKFEVLKLVMSSAKSWLMAIFNLRSCHIISDLQTSWNSTSTFPIVALFDSNFAVWMAAINPAIINYSTRKNSGNIFLEFKHPKPRPMVKMPYLYLQIAKMWRFNH